jgi:hypothetical protein
VLQSYIKGYPTDEVPDSSRLSRTCEERSDEDLSGLIRPDNARSLRTWQGHRIPVIAIGESRGSWRSYLLAQVPLLPKAIQVRCHGTAERKEELRRTLREALKGTKGTSNW